MHGNSQTYHQPAPPPLAPAPECFATVLLVEAENAAAQAVRVSLDGVLGDALHLERVAGLAEASARLARGSVAVILVGRNVSDCRRDQALMQLGLGAPETLILPLRMPEPGGTGGTGASARQPAGDWCNVPRSLGERDMSESTVGLSIADGLRREAEQRLSTGQAPASSGWTISAEALSLLYRLASAPDTADDALKLLHELQAYQVELDLQHRQLEANERELEQELARYRGLYEAAPVGYLILALEGQILEGNPAAAGLLGMDPDDLPGRRLDSFLAPNGRPGLEGMLSGLRAGGPRANLDVQIGDGDSPRAARLAARRSPGGEAILVGITDSH